MSAVVFKRHVRLRNMREEDLPAVMEVELAAYEFPWTFGIFRDCIRFGYVCKVLSGNQGIIGHGIMSLGAGECHLLNICIHPQFHGQGYGTELTSQLLDVARERHAKTALLEVRMSNPVAYHVYSKLGFHEIGIRRGYYPARKGREDAIILARDI